MQDHLGTVGLWHKVRGAVGQCSHLVRLAAALGRHDDRDQRQLIILLDPVQKGISVHHGHHHIQKDQRDAVLVLPQDIQRLLAVLRLQDPIVA